MASNTIKGITVALGSDTTELNESMDKIAKSSKETQKELNLVNKALKFDPSNTVLLTQKQELLAEQAGNVQAKLSNLESIQNDVEKAFESGDLGAEQYRAFQREVESCKSKLQTLEKQSEETENKINDAIYGNISASSQLKATISAQEKELKSLKEQYTEVVLTQGKTSDEAQQLKNQYEKLNDELNQNEKELKEASIEAEDTGKELKEMGKNAADSETKFDSLKNASKSLASKGLDAVKTSAKAVAAGITATAAGVTAAGVAIFNSAESTAAAGDEIDKQSQKLELSAENYQKLSYAANLCGTNMATMQTAQKALKASGSDLDLTEAIKQVASISDESERSAKAVELFGKKAAQELQPMLNAGTEGIEDMFKAAEDLGLVMSNENVAASAKFQDSLTTLTSTAGAVKDSIVSNLLPGLTTAMDGITGLFTGDEGAVDNIKSGLSDMITSVEEMVPKFSQIFGTLANAFTEILPTVIEAITTTLASLDIGENIIKPICTAIISNLPLLADAALSIITTLVSCLIEPQNLKVLLGVAVDIFSTIITGLTTALPDLISALLEILPTVLQSVIDALILAIPQIIEAVVQIVTAIAEAIPTIIPILVEALPQIINSIVTALITAIPQIINAGIQLLTAIIGALPDIIKTIVDALPEIISNIITGLLNALPQLIEAGITLFLALIEALPEIIIAIVEALPQIIDGIINGLLSALPQLIDAGVQLFVALIENTPKIIMGICEHIPEIITGIVNGFASLFDKMCEIGGNILEGLWQGICDGAEWLWNCISGFCEDLWGNITEFFGIHSPSRLFRDELGKNLMLGWSIGIDDNSKDVMKSISDVSSGIEDISQNSVISLQDNLSDFDGFNANIKMIEPNMSNAAPYSENSTIESPINIYLNFGGVTLSGGYDTDRFADDIMSALGSKIAVEGMAWG